MCQVTIDELYGDGNDCGLYLTPATVKARWTRIDPARRTEVEDEFDQRRRLAREAVDGWVGKAYVTKGGISREHDSPPELWPGQPLGPATVVNDPYSPQESREATGGIQGCPDPETSFLGPVAPHLQASGDESRPILTDTAGNPSESTDYDQLAKVLAERRRVL